LQIQDHEGWIDGALAKPVVPIMRQEITLSNRATLPISPRLPRSTVLCQLTQKAKRVMECVDSMVYPEGTLPLAPGALFNTFGYGLGGQTELTGYRALPMIRAW
jgi:hypothetical protein